MVQSVIKFINIVASLLKQQEIPQTVIFTKFYSKERLTTVSFYYDLVDIKKTGLDTNNKELSFSEQELHSWMISMLSSCAINNIERTEHGLECKYFKIFVVQDKTPIGKGKSVNKYSSRLIDHIKLLIGDFQQKRIEELIEAAETRNVLQPGQSIALQANAPVDKDTLLALETYGEENSVKMYVYENSKLQRIYLLGYGAYIDVNDDNKEREYSSTDLYDDIKSAETYDFTNELPEQTVSPAVKSLIFHTPEDLQNVIDQVTEIVNKIKTLPQSAGGKKKSQKTKKTMGETVKLPNGQTRRVIVGPRGGKYVRLNGKEVRLADALKKSVKK